MVADVLSDEGGDEEVRVVVALLHVQREPHALLRARRREVLGQQLLLHVEVVVRALKASSVDTVMACFTITAAGQGGAERRFLLRLHSRAALPRVPELRVLVSRVSCLVTPFCVAGRRLCHVAIQYSIISCFAPVALCCASVLCY